MPPKVFHEFGRQKLRERWPVNFDLEGIDRDHGIREAKLTHAQIEEPMSQPVSNSFVGGASIDLNRPPKAPYNHMDPKNQYPKMLYHPTKKDPNWLAEFKRLTLYNSLHPEKPEILPVVPPAFIIVNNADEEKTKLAAGFVAKPPAPPEVDEFADVAGEALCSRGCGGRPHRGACKKEETV